MSNIIDSYRFVTGSTPIYDGISVIYELERPDMTTLWTNAILKIRRDSDNATAFLFFLNNATPTKADTITTSSFIDTSSDTTESATTLSTWIGSNNGFGEIWYGMTDDNSINTNLKALNTTTSQQPKIVTTGSILTKNSKPDLLFDTSGMNLNCATSNSDLDSGNKFTVFAVAYRNSSGLGCIATTRDLSAGNNARFHLNVDRRTNKFITQVVNTSGTATQTLLSSQVDSSDQRMLTAIVDGTTPDVTARYNEVEQDVTAWTGDYDNIGLKLGQDRLSSITLLGGIQIVAIFPSDKTSELSTIESDIDSRYSIP